MSISSVTSSERIENFDWIKGVLIYFVVVGHVIQFNDARGVYSAIFNWIYSFHMPVFFIISGFFLAFSFQRNSSLGTIVKKRFFSLFIPYVIWTYFLPLVLKQSSLDLNPRWLYDSDGRYWFIQVLFYISLIQVISYQIASKIANCKVLTVILNCSIMLCLFLVLYILFPCNITEKGIYYFPLYFCGVAAFEFDLFKWVSQTRVDLSIILLLFVVCSLSYNWYSYGYNGIPLKFFKYPAGISATIILWKYSIAIDYSNWFNRFLLYCGKNSIVIYLSHFGLVVISKDLLSPCGTLTFSWTLFVASIFSIFIVLTSLFMGKLMEQFPFLNKLLYGRH